MSPQDTDHTHFKELVDNLKLGVFRQSPGPEGRFLFVSARFCSILGYSPQEMMNTPVSAVFAEKRVYQSLLQQLQKADGIINRNVQLMTSQKRIFLFSIFLIAQKNRKGEVTAIDGSIENITLRKKTEDDLRESKELFETVFNNSAAAIIVADKDEKVIAWNPFAEELLKMNQKELFNKPVADLYPQEEWRKMRSLRVRQRGRMSDIETLVHKKDRSLLNVNVSLSVIKDAKGNIIGSIGIMHDITKQKLAEKQMKESENKIRIILDNSAAAITMTDEQERLVSWNQYTEQLLGMNKEDLYLKPVSTLYPPEEWGKIQKMNIQQEGSKHHLETKIIRKEGKVIDVDLSINVLKDSSGQVIGAVASMQDITKQKRIQRMLLEAKNAAEEANSAKSLFLANMSHEVRTPMNTIMGMVDLTLDTELTEEQHDNLTTVKNAADILLSLLNDILDLSRVEAGKIELENIEISMQNIVKSVCKGLSVLARNKNLGLDWDVEDSVPEILMGDPVRIRQVLVNLINNAIKFTFKGKIVVKVSLEKTSDDLCSLRFSVSDEGVGISEDKLETIFDVFTQADASTTRKFGGTGLGLTISKKLVEMMGGKIWAESEEFKGTTFHFTGEFKIVRKEDVPQALKEESIEDQLMEQLPGRRDKKLSILLAEDNIVNQKIAARMLEKKGWTVRTADNGQEVLDHLDRESFDLILMDAQMPVLDGFETTRKIRDNEKDSGKHIPIVALTARAMSGDRRKCLESGMDGYVSKPIDRGKLFEAIEKLV